MREIRRIIAGVNEDGQSVFTSDEIVQAKVPPLLGGNEIINLFGADETPTVPNADQAPSNLRYFPPTHGYRFGIFTFPPESETMSYDDFDEALAETERQVPGMTDAVTDASGMHATSTIDLEYVIDGEFTLTLDSGESKVAKTGDTIVHCGENHAWTNKSDRPATMLVVFIGAKS